MDNIELYIRGNRKAYSGPSDWNEVPAPMALQLVSLATIAQQKPEAMLMISEILYGISHKDIRWLFDANYIRHCEPSISEEDIEQCLENGLALLQHCAWVFEKDPPSNWLLKSFQKSNKTFYGPADGLASSSFEEFMFAEQFYAAALAKGDGYQDNLTKLVCCLYRVGSLRNQSETGDARNLFTLAGIDVMFPLFKQLHDNVKELIFFNYRGIRLELASSFNAVFKVSETSTGQEGNWLDVAVGLAGENFINLAAIKKENVYVVLKYLNSRIEQYEKLKEKTPQL